MFPVSAGGFLAPEISRRASRRPAILPLVLFTLLSLITPLLAVVTPAGGTPGFTETTLVTGLDAPSSMAFAPDGRLFVTLQGGQVRVVKNGQLLATPFATLPTVADVEEGLVGLAFDPAFATNGYVYVCYTAQTPTRHNRVSRLTASGDVSLAGSEVAIFDLDTRTGPHIHAGGGLHFGPDGTLYIGSGDAGSGINSQNLTTTAGKLLRIRTDGSIPENNPFYATATGIYRSIWAIGLRNPYTFDFKPGTNVLYINDVGAANWEEVNFGIAGANYGWPYVEGPSSNPSYTPPIHAYSHSDGCAITGGAFYAPHEAAYPAEFVGKYFYADYCAGRIRYINPMAPTTFTDLLQSSTPGPVDVRTGPDGNLYVLTQGSFALAERRGAPSPTGSATAAGAGAIVRISYLIGDAPTILADPVDISVLEGQAATFRAAAAGGATLSCQWLRDDVEIPGATNFTYVRSAVDPTDGGAAFACRVSNSSGAILTRRAILTVLPPDSLEIVNWGGDYVAQDLPLRDSGFPGEFNVDLGGGWTGARWYIPFSATLPLTSGPMLGQNARFFGGLLIRDYSNALSTLTADVRDQGISDEQRSLANTRTIGWDFRFWSQEDFLNGADSGPVVFSPSSRIEILNYRGGDGQAATNKGRVYFVVRDAAGFWVSESYGAPAATPDADFVLNDPNGARWAPFAPAAPYDIAFDPTAATFAPRSFNGITGVGYLHTNAAVATPPAIGARAGFACERFRVVANPTSVTGVIEPKPSEPPRYLGVNRPNPFTAGTTIAYRVPTTTHVEVTIFDVTGRRLVRLVDGVQAAGEHEVRWEARGFAAGTYFYSLAMGGRVETRKLQLLR